MTFFVFALAIAFAGSAALLCDEALEHLKDSRMTQLILLALTVSALGGGISVLLVVLTLTRP